MTKQERKEYMKAWREAHKDSEKAKLKAWKEEHKEYKKTYTKSEVNSLGKTKESIRAKSNYYLRKYGTKIEGYEIHHCCTYTEPYKFIYCSRKMHIIIHQYLREHNIDSDSDHFEQIKHLLDDSVVKFGI